TAGVRLSSPVSRWRKIEARKSWYRSSEIANERADRAQEERRKLFVCIDMLGWNLVMAKGTRSLGRQFGLSDLLDELKRDDSLSDPDRFQERSKALDRLDGYDLDSQRPEVDLGENGGALHVRATALRTELEAINSRLYEGIRDAIRRGDGRDALLRWAPASKNNAVLRRHESIHD